MTPSRIIVLTFAALLPFVLPTAAQESGTNAAIHINLKEEKVPIPAMQQGIFMEEINHAFDGGIYAELIQNRSFEEGVLPPGMKLVTNANGGIKMQPVNFPPEVPASQQNVPWPWSDNNNWDPQRALVGWSLLPEGGATGTMKLTEANPMNDASSRSLEMTVTPPTDANGRVALINSGYWGINAQKDASYDLKFYLRPGNYQGSLVATLESRDGKVLAAHDFQTVQAGNEWQQFKATLKATDTDPRARFVLSFKGQGTLQVDWVSLFPPTWKNKPNGLRPDLAQYLADLKPGFVRYPGGCYVEGFSWESAPNWETMVRPPEERPGTFSYWKYRSTDGFGYHEFLQFCEDIHAEPLYVVNAGMTVHPRDNVPLADLGPFIQRALDALEYANGPVDSKWGAVRAKMGHPQPFNLKYMEIGNEHETAAYADYYEKFRSAIHEKYPGVTVILSMYWAGLNQPVLRWAGDANIDMVDEHAYHNDEWPRANFDYFDHYNHDVPWKMFVGEYASQNRTGDWGGGMGDSLYLMMLERNGDLIKMAAYAPLFVNIHDRTWNYNLIEYDSSRSFAHGSYYVQKVFRENRPDVNLATTVDVTPKPDPTTPLLAGKIGLGAWNTQTEFKELRVYDTNDKLVYSDDFTNLDGWATPGTGHWETADGVLKQTDEHRTPAMLLLKTPELTVGRVTVKARRVAGQEGFEILFNVRGRDRFFFCNYGANMNSFSAVQDHGVPAGLTFRGGRSRRGPMEDGRWYDLSLVLHADNAEMYLDGQRISTGSVKALSPVFAAGGYDRTHKTVVLKATNYNPTPLRTDITLDGAGTVGRAGRLISISSDSLDGDNTLDEPQRIVPRETPLENCSSQFSVTLPPYSVNVLRIPAEAN